MLSIEQPKFNIKINFIREFLQKFQNLLFKISNI